MFLRIILVGLFGLWECMAMAGRRSGCHSTVWDSHQIADTVIQEVLDRQQVSGITFVKGSSIGISCRGISSDGWVSFADALELAVESWITDSGQSRLGVPLEPEEESPRQIAFELVCEKLIEKKLSGSYRQCYRDPATRQLVEEYLTYEIRDYMNMEESYFELLPIGIQSNGGESPGRYWIFNMYLPRLSDHIFTAVVARRLSADGVIEYYNYGFN